MYEKLIEELLNAKLITIKEITILGHSRESSHSHVWKNDFKILNSNYRNNISRKISETPYI